MSPRRPGNESGPTVVTRSRSQNVTAATRTQTRRVPPRAAARKPPLRTAATGTRTRTVPTRAAARKPPPRAAARKPPPPRAAARKPPPPRAAADRNRPGSDPKRPAPAASKPRAGTNGDKPLETIYYDSRHPAGFSNPKRLWEATDRKIKKSRIESFLRGQDSYTLHKNVRKHFPRNVTYADNIDACWQADLADVSKIQEENGGHHFILCIVDVFSRYAWTLPLKDKTAETVADGFKTLFKTTERRCDTLITDKGKEFVNKKVKDFLKSHDIKYYHTRNPDTKCSIAERFIRTLRLWLQKVFTYNENNNYLGNVLADVTHAYNNKYHRTIRMTPVEASQPSRVLQVYNILYGKKLQVKTRPKLKVGDFVRISREKKRFEKSHTWNYSEEIFLITRVIRHPRPVYVIADLDKGEEIEGNFYHEELTKVNKPEFFKIDETLGKRGKGNKTEHLVHWRGYPKESNSWILTKDIITK